MEEALRCAIHAAREKASSPESWVLAATIAQSLPGGTLPREASSNQQARADREASASKDGLASVAEGGDKTGDDPPLHSCSVGSGYDCSYSSVLSFLNSGTHTHPFTLTTLEAQVDPFTAHNVPRKGRFLGATLRRSQSALCDRYGP